MKYKLVALDLDGTLVHTNHSVSDRAVKVLRRLHDMGVVIVIATGRAFPASRPVIKRIEVAHHIVCYNGSCSMRITREIQVDDSTDDVGIKGEMIHYTPLLPERVRPLLHLADRLGLVVQYYNGINGDVCAVPRTDIHQQHLDRYRGLTGKKQVILESYDEIAKDTPAAKVLLMVEESRVDILIEEAHKSFGREEYEIIKGSPHPFFVEFLPPNVCKGAGLKQLCSHLGIPLAEVVSFGDGENDKQMLSWTGMGCAMKNGSKVCKDHAAVVLDYTNDEDGVAIQLESMIEAGLF